MADLFHSAWLRSTPLSRRNQRALRRFINQQRREEILAFVQARRREELAREKGRYAYLKALELTYNPHWELDSPEMKRYLTVLRKGVLDYGSCYRATGGASHSPKHDIYRPYHGCGQYANYSQCAF